MVIVGMIESCYSGIFPNKKVILKMKRSLLFVWPFYKNRVMKIFALNSEDFQRSYLFQSIEIIILISPQDSLTSRSFIKTPYFVALDIVILVSK